MFADILLWLLLPWVFETAATEAECQDSPPLALPITDVELSNDHTMRGIPLSVGSPPQNMSFLLHNYLNNTWLYNSSAPACFSDTTKTQCLTIRGGTYDPSTSTAASNSLDVSAAGGDPSDTYRALGTHIWYNDWVTDTLQVGNISLEDFPIGMPGFDFGGIFDTQSNIGLGRNSTLLNALRDAGKISSRTYSYWWGINSASQSNSMDGQLVLGGYDAAKVTGPNITQKLLPSTVSCGSGMFLTITNMILGFPNGTRADMLAPSTLSACVQLDFPPVLSPRFDPFMERFQGFTGTSRMDNIANLPWDVPAFRLDGQYGGDLTIVLDQGSRFTLSNDVLILPTEYVAPDGAFKRNVSAPSIQMLPTIDVNVNDVPIVGRTFFSSAYVMVDLDAETWTLWQANATTDTRLIAVGGDCAEKPKVNTSPPANADNTTDPNPPSSTASDPSESTESPESAEVISTGAIVGIAVGAAFGLGLIVGASVIYCLRKRRQKKRSDTGSDIALTGYVPESNQKAYYCDEKDGGPVQELAAPGDYSHELPVSERPSEVPGGIWDNRPVELPAMQTPKP